MVSNIAISDCCIFTTVCVILIRPVQIRDVTGINLGVVAIGSVQVGFIPIGCVRFVVVLIRDVGVIIVVVGRRLDEVRIE